MDDPARRVHLRAAYFGPPGAGVATNLRGVYSSLREKSRFRDLTLRGNRTLSFSSTIEHEGRSVTLEVSGFTGDTDGGRARVLGKVDAVALILPWEPGRAVENAEACRVVRASLLENYGASGPGVVIQLNEMGDTEGSGSLELRNPPEGPVVRGSAASRDVAAETYEWLWKHAWQKWSTTHQEPSTPPNLAALWKEDAE